MRLTCSQKNLAAALVITSKAIATNNTLPVLGNVLLKAEGKKLFFTTTNLEIAIHYWIEADVKNEGEITIPSRLLTNYVNYLKDEKIDLTVEDGEVIIVKSSDSTTRIKGIPAAEFHPIPTVEKESEVVLSVSDFKNAINQVVFAASLNTTRPILSGVYFNVEKDTLKMVATDSYRLAEKTLHVKRASGEISCIIPARTLMEIAGVLDAGGEDNEITVVISKNQVLFVFGETQITSRLIDGQFPNYQQIIPTESKIKIDFNVHDLSMVLKRINIFAKENNNKIILRITKEGVVVTTDTTQYGGGEVVLAVETKGGEGEIALNSQYILDVLSNIGGNAVVFEVNEKTNPVVVKAIGKKDYTHIIMPLKV